MEKFLTYLGLALGIIGVISSYIFYRRSIRIKEPVYSISSNNLISGSVSTLENLNVTYKDYPVKNLTVSKVLFYNRGVETIRAEDIATSHHLSISSGTCDILDGSLLRINNLSNNFDVQYHEGSKKVTINFDYLDKNQGAVIQIVHTGLSSRDLEVNGDIMGVQKMLELPSDYFQESNSTKSRILAYVEIGSRVFLLLFLMLILFVTLYPFFTGNMVEDLFTTLFIGLFGGVQLVLTFSGLFKRLRGKMPKGLEKFLE